MTDTPNLPATVAPSAINPVELVDPAALVALFDADPATITRADLDTVIRELRLRADANKSAVAAAQAASASKPSRTKAVRAGSNPVSLAASAVADKPIAELSVDDLFSDNADPE